MTAYAWGRLAEAGWLLAVIVLVGACVGTWLRDRREERAERRLVVESQRRARALYADRYALAVHRREDSR